MSRLITEASSKKVISSHSGNKALNLYHLLESKIPTPEWVVIGTDTFEEAIPDTIQKEIYLNLKPLNKDSTEEDYQQASETISQLILTHSDKSLLDKLVEEAIERLGEHEFAVRSSGNEEDGSDFSFAGQFDSYLGVEGKENIIKSIMLCWVSVYSVRSLHYRILHGLSLKNIKIAVIIQRLIKSDVSGVLFTANITNGNPYELLISSVYGLGEGIVSGEVDADTIVLNADNASVIKQTIGKKEIKITSRGAEPVLQKEQEQCSLNKDDLKQLCDLAKKVKQHFTSDQDIEWCFENGKLWLLQSRSITQSPVWPKGEIQLWDNSNIVENYPGVTSHLTFSLTQHLYSNVFREYCQSLGVPRNKLSELNIYLKSMLAHINGRVYYNLFHWYKLVSVTPMKKVSRKMLEVHLGVNTPIDEEAFLERMEPYRFDSKFEELYIKTIIRFNFSKVFFFLNYYTNSFSNKFYKVFKKYDSIDYSELSIDETISRYKELDSYVIFLWGEMVTIESSIALPYGIMRKLIKLWIPDAPNWLETGLISGVHDIESLEPVEALSSIAQYINSHGDIKELLETGDLDNFFTDLKDINLQQQLKKYIDKFGYRSANELKLEEPDLRQKPRLLLQMLKTMTLSLNNSIAGTDSSNNLSKKIDDILHKNLNFIQYKVFSYVVKRVQLAIRIRERVRFSRSRLFGVFRNMFRALGDQLHEQDILEAPEDIFNLGVDEIKGLVDATTPHSPVKDIVSLRKKDMKHYRSMPDLPSRFYTQGPIASWLEKFGHSLYNNTDTGDGLLTGVTCAPGIVEGVAQVVSEPSEFTGGILVAYRTDPGWVAVFPSATAILVERGSPLTHASIVARELGLPTIVQIPGLTDQVKSGMTIQVDANQGKVTIIESDSINDNVLVEEES